MKGIFEAKGKKCTIQSLQHRSESKGDDSRSYSSKRYMICVIY